MSSNLSIPSEDGGGRRLATPLGSAVGSGMSRRSWTKAEAPALPSADSREAGWVTPRASGCYETAVAAPLGRRTPRRWRPSSQGAFLAATNFRVPP